MTVAPIIQTGCRVEGYSSPSLAGTDLVSAVADRNPLGNWAAAADVPLRALADGLPHGAFICDDDGIVRWNNRRFDHDGHAVDPSTAGTWLDCVHPSCRAEARAQWNYCVASATAFQRRLRLRAADRSHPWRQVDCHPFRDPDTGVRAWFGSAVEVDGETEATPEARRGYRRELFLARLDDALRSFSDAAEVHRTAARLLGEHVGADRCAYASTNPDEDGFEILGDWARGMPTTVGQYRMREFGEAALRSMQAGRSWVVQDAASDERITDDDRRAYQRIGMVGVICAPLLREGHFAACMAVHSRAPRRWLPEEVDLVEAVSARCWESIERIKAERLASARDKRFRALVEDSSNLLWSANAAGEIVEDSPSWRAFTGLSFDAFKGVGWLSAIHPDDQERVMSVVTSTVRAGRGADVEFRLRKADGSWRWIGEQIRPVRGPDGVVAEWVGMGLDITDRKREQQARDFLIDLDDAIRPLVDPDDIAGKAVERLCEFLQADRASYLDVDAEERTCTVIRNHARTIPPLSGSYVLENFGHDFLRCMREGRPHVIACLDDLRPSEAERAAYASLGIEAMLTIPLIKEGRLTVMIGIAQGHRRQWEAWDIQLVQAVMTRCWESIQRARIGRALQEADRRKDEFLATLAHELRNPLAPIRNALHIGLHPRSPVPPERLFVLMERQVNQLVRLVDDLLDVSRITRGKVELQHQDVQLEEAIGMAVETARPLIDERGHAFELRPMPRPLVVRGDAVRLTQIFANLLNNAAKYTPRGGSIVVDARAEGGEAVVRVIDNGIGVAAEMHDRIFDIFSQAGRSEDRSGGSGLGIGLALARSLAKLHGGRVEVSSPGPGKGSEFRVSLPLLASHAASPRRDETAPGDSISPARRVLVVDDNRDAADSIAVLLQLMGADVTVAYSAESALPLLDRCRPTLAILDLGLPGMDGFQLAREIRARLGTSIKLVALTGWGQADARRRSHEAGFDQHLIKPVDLASVESLVLATSG